MGSPPPLKVRRVQADATAACEVVSSLASLVGASAHVAVVAAASATTVAMRADFFTVSAVLSICTEWKVNYAPVAASPRSNQEMERYARVTRSRRLSDGWRVAAIAVGRGSGTLRTGSVVRAMCRFFRRLCTRGSTKAGEAGYGPALGLVGIAAASGRRR